MTSIPPSRSLGHATGGRALPGATPLPRAYDTAEWLKRHERFKAEAAKGNADLLFLGDSITDGWDTVAPGLYKSAFGAYKPLNFGIEGDRTQNVLWRMQNGELNGLEPKVAVLLIGTNNIGQGDKIETSESAVAGIKAIVDEIREKSPTTKLLLLGVFPREQNPEHPLRAVVKKTNSSIAKLDDGENVRFLDIGAKFLQRDGTISPDVMDDFLHLTPKGYRLWSEAIKKPLGDLMKRAGRSAR